MMEIRLPLCQLWIDDVDSSEMRNTCEFGEDRPIDIRRTLATNGPWNLREDFSYGRKP